MEVALWILAGLVGLIVLFALAGFVAGLTQPKDHTASRGLLLKQTPEAIWAVITDYAKEPEWQPHSESVTKLDDRNGNEAWMHKHKGRGNPPMILVTTEKVVPTRLVRTIDDTKQMFTGRWEFALTPADGGTRLTITEHGEIKNPFFRGMFRMFASPHTYIDMYLKALAGKFGEPANIT